MTSLEGAILVGGDWESLGQMEFNGCNAHGYGQPSLASHVVVVVVVVVPASFIYKLSWLRCKALKVVQSLVTSSKSTGSSASLRALLLVEARD